MAKSYRTLEIVVVILALFVGVAYYIKHLPTVRVDSKYIVQKQDSLIAVNNGKQAVYIEQQNRLNDELTERLKHRKTSVKTIREYVYLHSFDTLVVELGAKCDSLARVDSIIIDNYEQQLAIDSTRIELYKQNERTFNDNETILKNDLADEQKKVDKYRQQKRHRLNAFVATAGVLVATWLVILL